MLTQMPIDLLSSGFMQTRVEIPFSRLEYVLKELNIEPATRINGVPHYTGEDLERVRRHVAESR